MKKFEESRRLRSHLVPLQVIYLRCRLAAIIGKPSRTRATSQLRLVREFRKGHTLPRMFLSGSLPSDMTCLVKCSIFFVSLCNENV